MGLIQWMLNFFGRDTSNNYSEKKRRKQEEEEEEEIEELIAIDII